MNSTSSFYSEKLYPLQDGVLKIVHDLKLPFYLTGGTALSRHYLHHRFSGDIGLFVNDDNSFQLYVESLISFLSAEENKLPFRFNHDRTIRATRTFAQLYIMDQSSELKIDLVDDLPTHYGNFVVSQILGAIDSLENILSIKISALFRFAPRNYVDIWAISKKYPCDWKDALSHAKHKETAVNAGELSNFFRTFPFERLNEINWIESFDYFNIKEEFSMIAEDIFYGNQNRLA